MGLDEKQSKELARIIQQAQEKHTAAYAIPEGGRDMEQAWRGFFAQVFTRLHEIRRDDQRPKFMVIEQLSWLNY